MASTTFDSPSAIGAKVITVTHSVTNTSGSYSGTEVDERVTAAMRAIDIELENPEVFGANISVTCNNGSVSFTCADVVGSSDIIVSVIKVADDPTAVTSTEFDILNNRVIAAKQDTLTLVKKSVCPVITAATNNSGVDILKDEYFTVLDGTNDGLYVATSPISQNASWSANCTIQNSHGGLNALSSKIVDISYGMINTGNSTRSDLGTQERYYHNVTFPYGYTDCVVQLTLFNTTPLGYGMLSDPPIVSDITTTGCKIWTTVKLSGYYVVWTAIGHKQ